MRSTADGNGPIHGLGGSEKASVRPPVRASKEDLDEKIDRGDDDIVHSAFRAIVEGPLFGPFRANPRSCLRVGTLEPEVRIWAGYQTASVRLPARIMRKQEARSAKRKRVSAGHPELRAKDYRCLPALLEAPKAVFRPEPPRRRPVDAYDDRLCLWGTVDGRGYFAVVERDRATEKVELISFFRREMTESRVEKMLSRARKVFRKP